MNHLLLLEVKRPGRHATEAATGMKAGRAAGGVGTQVASISTQLGMPSRHTVHTDRLRVRYTSVLGTVTLRHAERATLCLACARLREGPHHRPGDDVHHSRGLHKAAAVIPLQQAAQQGVQRRTGRRVGRRREGIIHGSGKLQRRQSGQLACHLHSQK